MTAQTLSAIEAGGGLVVGIIATHLAHTQAGKAVKAEADRIHAWYLKHTTPAERHVIDQAAQDAIAAIEPRVSALEAQVKGILGTIGNPGAAAGATDTTSAGQA